MSVVGILKPLEIERVSIYYSCATFGGGKMASIFLDKCEIDREDNLLLIPMCPVCHRSHSINLSQVETYVYPTEDEVWLAEVRDLQTSKKEIEAKLNAWGAEKDVHVSGVWWLNGHCFRIIPKGNEYTLEEL